MADRPVLRRVEVQLDGGARVLVEHLGERGLVVSLAAPRDLLVAASHDLNECLALAEKATRVDRR